jgi:hypothetical protein
VRRVFGQLQPFLPPLTAMPTKPHKLALATEARLVALAWLHGTQDNRRQTLSVPTSQTFTT